MKKILFFVLLLGGCKKNSEETVSVLVKDLITNTPVKEAKVYVYKCVQTDPFCGLIAWIGATTGEDGRCSFYKANFDRVTLIEAQKADYWGFRYPKTTSLSINPAGWLRLRITWQAAYPPQSKLILLVESANFPDYRTSLSVNTTADSSVLIRSFGGQTNKITWVVTNSSSGTLNNGEWSMDIPRLDTIQRTLVY